MLTFASIGRIKRTVNVVVNDVGVGTSLSVTVITMLCGVSCSLAGIAAPRKRTTLSSPSVLKTK